MAFDPLPLFLFAVVGVAFSVGLIVLGSLIGPSRTNPVKEMPYESGMDPFHDTRRRFDFRFHLVAIAFLIFDVELIFLYPWAVASRATGEQEALGIDAAVQAGEVASRDMVFCGAMFFVALLTIGLLYEWRKGVFQWR